MANAGFINIQNVSGRRMRPARFATRKPEFPSRLNRGFWQQGTPSRWLFNEGAGSTAYDIGNKNNGTLAGGATWSSGSRGAALKFDGTTGIAKLATTYTFSNYANGYAIGGWISHNVSAFGDGAIFSQDRASFASDTLEITGNGTTWHVLFKMFNNSFSSQSITGILAVPKNIPTHIVGVYTPAASGTLSIYVNGVFDSSLTNVGTPRPITGDQQEIGSVGNGAGAYTHFFTGLIYDLFVGPALTAAQIQQLYAQPYLDIQPRRLWVPEATASGGGGGLWPWFTEGFYQGSGRGMTGGMYG